jgi:hypothetical protein
VTGWFQEPVTLNHLNRLGDFAGDGRDGPSRRRSTQRAV